MMREEKSLGSAVVFVAALMGANLELEAFIKYPGWLIGCLAVSNIFATSLIVASVWRDRL